MNRLDYLKNVLKQTLLKKEIVDKQVRDTNIQVVFANLKLCDLEESVLDPMLPNTSKMNELNNFRKELKKEYLQVRYNFSNFNSN